MGQVYKCRLLKASGAHAAGAEVALKIQRPDMIACVSRDLFILRKYTQCVETFKALRHLDPTAKIILSSGFTEGEVLQKMDGIRPNGFLQKPYRLETVLKTVEKHLL